VLAWIGWGGKRKKAKAKGKKGQGGIYNLKEKVNK
jgi:hypothetical protein